MLREALRRNWQLYLIEGGALACFMVVACSAGALIDHPSSAVRHSVATDWLRRALFGVVMGCTAMAIIYSPLGKRSGAHINPSVTLTFLRLGKVGLPDATWYVAAQFVGATAGVIVAVAVFGMRIMHPSVRYVVTLPGPRGSGVAFVAELGISFVLLTVVLAISSVPRWQRFTGVCAGVLVAIYITVEAPLSGMSMNPARTFGSGVVAGVWTAMWVYFLAPPLGMLAAAQLHLWLFGARPTLCAKMRHDPTMPCHFCAERAARAGARSPAPTLTGTISGTTHF